MSILNLDSLNKEQKNAVLYNEGPLRIIAGAGAGKTKVLTNKIVYLIEELRIDPEKILALTFSNKAANEMKQRAFALIEDAITYPTISTFHSLCAKILRREIHVMNFPNDFQIIDELDQREVLKVVYSELNISQSSYTYNSLISFIQNQKNLLKTPEDLEKDSELKNDIRTKIYKHYQQHLGKAHTLDFDDLLVFVHRLFYSPKYTKAAEKWSNEFTHILVDEFQDTSLLQYEILKQLAKNTNHLTIVGDPDQTIYSWRNADINIIMNFDKDFKNTQTIKLEQNYRSTKKILNVANNLISHNKVRFDKKLFTENDEGVDVDLFVGFNEEAEARWVAQRINELKKQRVQLKNIAILFRINSYSRSVEEALIKENTIYKLFGSIKFYQREEIKDTLAYLRVIHDGSEISLLRIINKPLRRIGEATIEKLLKFAEENKLDLYKCLETKLNDIHNKLGISVETIKNIAILINAIRYARSALKNNSISLTIKDFMINKIGYFEDIKKSEEEYESRMENFLSLISAIENWEQKNKGGKIDEYLQEITLITDRDVEDDAASYVSLMTVHNAKGLEFDYVFVIGLSEGIFPLKRAISISLKEDFSKLNNVNSEKYENIEALEEERRIAYVAMTRAKERLYLSLALNKNSKRSRFVLEAGIRERKMFITASQFKNAIDITDNDSLIVGDYISHSTYGIGQIVEVKDKDIICVKFAGEKKIKNILRHHESIKKWESNDK
ncbi:ATP-dependent helicase [Metamycoplasma hyosynoviae]|uniref:ATP-dependent helicase n=1 Tax=Metamycoplasma hyosynoviae TaxID=29559 RepID=UPI002358AA6F|nr:ATP-dependent helicase [Metamycoplasma hyosynoviae]MDC8963096.1 ATP-dependent helicase [Metamycoplasma hyosynoviae]